MSLHSRTVRTARAASDPYLWGQNGATEQTFIMIKPDAVGTPWLSHEITTDEERLRPQSSEVNRLFGDNSLLKKLTSWSPSYSGIEGFEKGLKETINWFSQPENLIFYKPDKYNI